jgi:hypothetical protein
LQAKSDAESAMPSERASSFMNTSVEPAIVVVQSGAKHP